jgi:hypothetical protein
MLCSTLFEDEEEEPYFSPGVDSNSRAACS